MIPSAAPSTSNYARDTIQSSLHPCRFRHLWSCRQGGFWATPSRFSASGKTGQVVMSGLPVIRPEC